ncbi:hypothetical protein [Jatrophihabitans fulvus]
MSATHLLAAGETKPLVDWEALGKVAGVSLLFGLAVVVLFSLAVVGLSMARGHDRAAVTDGAPGVTASQPRLAGSLLAGLGFVASGGAVLYGLWLIIPQFH